MLSFFNSLRKCVLITSKSKINMTSPNLIQFYYCICRFQQNLNSIKVILPKELETIAPLHHELTLSLWLFCLFIRKGQIVFTTVIWTKQQNSLNSAWVSYTINKVVKFLSTWLTMYVHFGLSALRLSYYKVFWIMLGFIHIQLAFN